MIEICTVGGYDEVGRNCTAVRVGNEVVIFDIGLHLENYIRYTNDEDIVVWDTKELIKVKALPDVSRIDDWKSKVVAIVPTHAHLDHLGGVPFLANRYNAQILCTPYTAEVLKRIVADEKIELKNKIRALGVNSVYQISANLRLEFIEITHSTPHTVMAALHTKDGTVMYCNDFKFDLYPTLGKKPDFDRIARLGEKGVLCLIADSTYASERMKMPSESVAKQLLKDVLLGVDSRKKAIVVTTFSSHIARLKSILEFGKKLGRKVVFLGRSMAKYVYAAEDTGIFYFSKQAEIVKYRSQIKKKLKQIMKEGKHKYLIVVTGHQGEPKATLSRMVDGEMGFRFDADDHVIFSCKVIPTDLNRQNRDVLENKLNKYKVKIFRDIHVSGHAAREDLRQLIELTTPEHIIPAHGDITHTSHLLTLAEELGYENEKDVHIMTNGKRIEIKKIKK